MRSWLAEQFGHRVQIRDIDRVPSGSRAHYRLRARPDFSKTVSAALILAKRHMRLRDAKSAVEYLLEKREVTIEVPQVEDTEVFERELHALGIDAVQSVVAERTAADS
jgi:hypothetical protein